MDAGLVVGFGRDATGIFLTGGNQLRLSSTIGGTRLLLIGHLDTVFEKDSPFQKFTRVDGRSARVTLRRTGREGENGETLHLLHVTALRARSDAGG